MMSLILSRVGAAALLVLSGSSANENRSIESWQQIELQEAHATISLPCSHEQISKSTIGPVTEVVCRFRDEGAQESVLISVRRSSTDYLLDVLPLRRAAADASRALPFERIKADMREFLWTEDFESLKVCGRDAFTADGIDPHGKVFAVGLVDLGSDQVLSVRIRTEGADVPAGRYGWVLNSVMQNLEFAA